MFRLLVFNAIIFLGVFVFTPEAKLLGAPGCHYYFCGYFADPHLVPFYQPNAMYWCKTPGWELLLSNQYVTIYVLVDGPASGYAIIDYMLVFPGPPSCTSFGNSWNAWPCTGVGSPVLTFVFSNTRMYFHTTQCLVIKITKWGSYFDIYIWQSPDLIRDSCGVCVRWNCPREYRNPWVDNAIPQICDAYIAAARANAIGNVDPAMIELAKTACINDIDASLNINNAKAAAGMVLQSGLENLLAGEYADTMLAKLEQAEQQAIQDATAKTNILLSKTSKLCNKERCLSSYDSTTTTAVPWTTRFNTSFTRIFESIIDDPIELPIDPPSLQ